MHFYESDDLKSWTLTGEFEINTKDENVWECPDLFPLNLTGTETQKWVLVVNQNPGGYQTGSGVKYFIGEFDGKTFKADDTDKVSYVDHGSDFYAATSFFDYHSSPDKRIVIGWMSNWHYSSDLPTSPWRG